MLFLNNILKDDGRKVKKGIIGLMLKKIELREKIR